MEYTREYWQPRIATKPNRFRKLNETTDYVELINEPEEITQAGTAFTADRLNNMESGIDGAVAGVNEIQRVVDLSAPVDCTSRVAEYTGDGIPLIPDNEAGTTYRSNFATTDGWTSPNSTLSVANGTLTLNKKTTTAYNGLMDKTISASGKLFVVKITPLQTILSLELRALLSSVSTTLYAKSLPVIGKPIYISLYNADEFDTVRILGQTSTMAQTGELFTIDFVYIGSGLYDTPALDRAGNGNSLTLNAVTPVSGKYGKEMSFNGSTSYAQASSPVIGTTGTLAVRFKLNAATVCDVALNTSDAILNGFRLRVDAGGSLNAFIAGSSSRQNISLGTIGSVSYNTLVISWDGTTVTKTIAGVTTTEAQTVSMTPALFNLTLGKATQSAANFFNGIISHFRYDSRIWTADEARAWSLNPSNGESLSMSNTPSPGDVMVWPDSSIKVWRSDNDGPGSGLEADTATKLATARKINGVSFDGSTDITVADSTKAPTSHASSATTYGASSETNYGHVKASTVAGSPNGTASKGTTPTIFAQSNHVHPLQTSVSGNAGTATKLANARTITIAGDATGSTTFDGSANKTITLSVEKANVRVSLRHGDTWFNKTWTGLTDFIGDLVWSDGENIYYSSTTTQMVLNKATSTWSPKTWTGFTDILGEKVWSDGENIYFSSNTQQYVLNKSTSTWSPKTWTGLTNFQGYQVWSDGENIYFSSNTQQYVLPATRHNYVDENKYKSLFGTDTNCNLKTLSARFVFGNE